MGREKDKKNELSAALEVALQSVFGDLFEEIEAETELFLDTTEPVGDLASFEAADDAEQELLAKLRRSHALDSPTHH